MRTISIVSLTFLLILVNCAVEEKSPIEGTWRLTEYKYNSADTSWIYNPTQPGLFIFGKDYYSFMYVNDDKARPLMPEEATRYTISDEQVISSFMTFYANSGKYEMDASKLTVYPIVALYPNYMNGTSTEYEFKIEGETLYITRTTTGLVRNYKLVRLE